MSLYKGNYYKCDTCGKEIEPFSYPAIEIPIKFLDWGFNGTSSAKKQKIHLCPKCVGNLKELIQHSDRILLTKLKRSD